MRLYDEASEKFSLIDRKRFKYVADALQRDSRIESVKYQWDREEGKFVFGVTLKPTALKPKSTVLIVRFNADRFTPPADPHEVVTAIDHAITLRDQDEIPEVEEKEGCNAKA